MVGRHQPSAIRRRHVIEDLAARVGDRRIHLESELATNAREITNLASEAQRAGIPLESYANLVGISRQTLYRWQQPAQNRTRTRDSGAKP